LEDLGFLICKPCGGLKKNKIKREEELCIDLMFSAFSDSNKPKKKKAI